MIESIKYIAEHYGNDRQLLQTMEECAELAKECSKTIRKATATTEHLTEEIGDVCLMIAQVMYLNGITEHDVLEVMKMKISRTLKKIEKGDK